MEHAVRQPQPLLQPFYPALDGVRALAVLLVFCGHFCTVEWHSAVFAWGFAGVDIFFVLSGFLITGLLFETRTQPRFFRTFYMRRALRIFPLYFSVWLFFLLATPVLHFQWNRYVAATAFYVGNLFKGGAGTVHADPGLLFYTGLHHLPDSVLIDHFWSLGVEEQFYLVWPFIVLSVRSGKRLLGLCCVLAVATPLGRILYRHMHPSAHNYAILYYNTLSRADALFLGAAVFLWLRCFAPSVRAVRRVATGALLLAPPMLFFLHLAESANLAPGKDPVVHTIGFSLINIASAGLLLLAIDERTPVYALLHVRPLLILGRVSYGFYVFSELIVNLATRVLAHISSPLAQVSFPFISFAFVLGLSLASFRFLEAPFLALKSRLAPRPRAVEDPPPSGSIQALSAPMLH